jgi:hypothetical protein
MEPTVLQLKAIAWSISPWCYVAYAALLSAVVRLVLTLFRCYRFWDEHRSSFRTLLGLFGRLMVGRGLVELKDLNDKEKERNRGDYVAPFVIGFLELLTFPILLAAGLHIYVGAWISLKLVAQYKHWADDRNTFNAFLLGNGLIVVFAFVFLQQYVSIKK